MKIGFLGLGKLGLPVALAVESKGHQVIGTDINETTLRNIRFKTITLTIVDVIFFVSLFVQTISKS